VRDGLMRRGQRLDRKGQGAGLGLAIVSEVLEAYGRTLVLETSPLGGLRATF
jgi:signal transduction histidine kinase